MMILVSWIIVFFCSTGIYFSSLFKRTTTAVVMNFILGAVIWMLIPFLMVITAEMTNSSDDMAEAYLNLIPYVHGVVVIDATVHDYRHVRGSISNYDWPQMNNMDAYESTLFMLAIMYVYLFVSFIFAWRAKSRFRRNVF